jgi:hypothetical protein
MLLLRRAVGERVALVPLQGGVSFRGLVIVVVVLGPVWLVLLGGISHNEVATLELANVGLVQRTLAESCVLSCRLRVLLVVGPVVRRVEVIVFHLQGYKVL